MRRFNTKLLKFKQNDNSKLYTIYYNNRIVIVDAEKYNVFGNVLAVFKFNSLFVFELCEKIVYRRYVFYTDNEFLNVLAHINNKRYIISKDCEITYLGTF